MSFVILSFFVRIVFYCYFTLRVLKIRSRLELLSLWAFLVPFSGVQIELVGFTLSLAEVVMIAYVIFSITRLVVQDAVSFRFAFYLFVLATLIGLSFPIIFTFLADISVSWGRFTVQTSKMVFYSLFVMLIMVDSRKFGSGVTGGILRNVLDASFIASIAGIAVFTASSVLGADILPLERTQPLFAPGLCTNAPLVGTPLIRAHFLNEPKGLAAWSCIGLIISLYYLEKAKSIEDKRRFRIRSFVLVISIVLSFSRGGLLQFLAIIAVYLTMRLFGFFRERRIKNIAFLVVVIILAVVFLQFSRTLPTGLFSTILFSENLERTLLEDYDYAISEFYINTPKATLLPLGMTLAESYSRIYIPEDAPWALTANFSIRRGFILSTVEYGVFGSAVLFVGFIVLGLSFLWSKDLGSLFLLISWFIFYLMQVEAGTVAFHKVMFAIVYSLAYAKDRSMMEENGSAGG